MTSSTKRRSKPARGLRIGTYRRGTHEENNFVGFSLFYCFGRFRLQLAESHLTRRLFGQTIERVNRGGDDHEHDHESCIGLWPGHSPPSRTGRKRRQQGGVHERWV